MVETKSNSMEIETRAINFKLEDQVNFNIIELEEYRGEKATVIIFMCNHCPYVVHIIDKLSSILNSYQDKGVSSIAINSNDIKNYPADRPELMAEFAKKHNFKFPYVFDETQEVAKKYNAACTPDIYVYDDSLKLTYHGRFDDSTPGNNKPLTGNDLKKAIDATIHGEKIENQLPSIGCNIKFID